MTGVRGSTRGTRVAVITTHPIQYNAPWFRYLVQEAGLALRVFYLWDFGVAQKHDPQFGQAIRWDIPLLDGYEYEFVPNSSRRAGTDHFFGLWNPTLTERVRAFRPDAVLLLTYNYATLYRFIAEWDRRDAPLLFRGDSHRLLLPKTPFEWLRRRLIATVFRRFDACLYVGAANRRYFEYHDVEADRLFFSPHAVDNDRFISQADVARREAARWRAEMGIPEDHRLILFAAKFEARKRPMDLLEAFLKARLPRASVLFVGSGEMEAALHAAKHPGVYIAPFQNQSLMPRTYAAGDLFVMPSGHIETWGLAVNEAMCLSRPVVVSTLVGCAEDLVTPYENGLIFGAGDVAALAASLREALADDDRLRQWGEAGRRRIERYSYATATEGLLRALAAVGRVAPSPEVPRRHDRVAATHPATTSEEWAS